MTTESWWDVYCDPQDIGECAHVTATAETPSVGPVGWTFDKRFNTRKEALAYVAWKRQRYRKPVAR